MALIKLNFHSQSLARTTDLYVIKPDYLSPDKEVSLLYLLHGYTGDYTNWIRFSNIEKYVFGKNLIVVMPSAYNSYFTDLGTKEKHFTYVAVELPKFIESIFNLKVKRENTFVAGLSMGGYGALKIALTYPERYSKAASFSGALIIQNMITRVNLERKKHFEVVFGKTLKKEDDLFYLATEALNKVDLYISCGTEDAMFKDSAQFHQYLKEINFNHFYITKPGNHNWEFWDQEIKQAIEFFINE
ncbi:MAG: esterase family protein [Acholeplasmataceae bacterium]|jgi:S-formylglutathione hydrolase FrmB|nr:esterase family protein [Acholeplasmataceae bacterium]